MRDVNNKLSKEMSIIVFGKGLSILLSLIGLNMITHLLTPEEYGLFSLYLTISSLGILSIYGPIGQGVVRFYVIARERKMLKSYQKTLVELLRNGTLLIVLLSLTGMFWLFLQKKEEWLYILPLVCILSCTEGSNFVLSMVQNSARNRVLVAFHEVLDKILKIIIPYLFLILLSRNSISTLLGFVVVAIIVLGSQVFFLRQKEAKLDNYSNLGNHLKLREDIIRFTTPFAFLSLFSWLRFNSDKWIISYILGTKAVGTYSALYQIGFQPLNLLTITLSQLLLPVLFEIAEDGKNTVKLKNAQILNGKFIVLFTFFVVFLVLLSFCFSSNVIQILLGSTYEQQSYILPYLVIAGGLYGGESFITNQALINVKSHTLVFSRIFTGVSNIFFCYIGTFYFGMIGLVVGLILNSLLFYVLIFYKFNYDSFINN